MSSKTAAGSKPRVRQLSRGEYRLTSQEHCWRGTTPHGNGDTLIVEIAKQQLQLFIPDNSTLTMLFPSDAIPDSLLLTTDVRRGFLMRHIETNGICLLGEQVDCMQVQLIDDLRCTTESVLHEWFYGVNTSLGNAALRSDASLAGLPFRTIHPTNLAPPRWLLPITCRVGWTALPLKTIKHLEKGDLLMISFRQQTFALGSYHGGSWRFDETGIRSEDAMNDGELWTDSFEHEDASTDINELFGALQEVTINLEVVLGEAAMPLTQVASLAKEQWIPLTQGGLNATRLRLNNQTIAIGELIEIEGELGIIIKQLFYSPGLQSSTDE